MNNKIKTSIKEYSLPSLYCKCIDKMEPGEQYSYEEWWENILEESLPLMTDKEEIQTWKKVRLYVKNSINALFERISGDKESDDFCLYKLKVYPNKSIVLLVDDKVLHDTTEDGIKKLERIVTLYCSRLEVCHKLLKNDSDKLITKKIIDVFEIAGNYAVVEFCKIEGVPEHIKKRLVEKIIDGGSSKSKKKKKNK